MPTSYWEVASYGYPNPFSSATNAGDAWDTLLSFDSHSSYAALKAYWNSAPGGRQLSSHAVESWKSALEEFGLVYVLRGDDTIHITPGGQQLIDAGKAGRLNEFARVGLLLLLRYPLRGARRHRNHALSSSDLLPYWFLYAAMRELDNELWQGEIKRILCKVTRVDEAQAAVNDIKSVRASNSLLTSFALPVSNEKGKFYNTINQITVHGSLSYLVFHRETAINPTTGASDIRFFLPTTALDLVDETLGGSANGSDCDKASRFVARMPAAPTFTDEISYFTYLGAPVPSQYLSRLVDVPILGDVVVLTEGVHYQIIPTLPGTLPIGCIKIAGPIGIMCQLARDQRVIVGHDLNRSYKVVEKQRDDADTIVVILRRALPITNAIAVNTILDVTRSVATRGAEAEVDTE